MEHTEICQHIGNLPNPNGKIERAFAEELFDEYRGVYELQTTKQNRLAYYLARAIKEGTYCAVKHIKEDEEYIIPKTQIETALSDVKNANGAFESFCQQIKQTLLKDIDEGHVREHSDHPELEMLYDCMTLTLNKKQRLMGMDHLIDKDILATENTRLCEAMQSAHGSSQLAVMSTMPCTYMDGTTALAILHAGLFDGMGERMSRMLSQFSEVKKNYEWYINAVINKNDELMQTVLTNISKITISPVLNIRVNGAYGQSETHGSCGELATKLKVMLSAITAEDYDQLYNEVMLDGETLIDYTKEVKDRVDQYTNEKSDNYRDSPEASPVQLEATVKIMCLWTCAVLEMTRAKAALVALSELIAYYGSVIPTTIIKRMGTISESETKTIGLFESLHAGNNDISFQGSNFTNQLAELIGDARESETFTPKWFNGKSGIVDLIFKHTGMLIKFEIFEAFSANAAVMPRMINPNHVFLGSDIRKLVSDYFFKSKEYQKEQKGVKEGTINLNTGKVGGYYSEVENTMYLSCLPTWKKYTDHEITAVILHELGHVFYNFYRINLVFFDVSVLSRTIKEVSGIKDPRKRKDIIVTEFKKIGMEIADPETLTDDRYNGKEEELIGAIYVDGATHKRKELLDKEYQNRVFEQLADNFAVMHGAGGHIGTALAKIYAENGENSMKGSFGYYFFNTLLFVVTVISPPVAVLVIATAMLDDSRQVYDDFPKRIATIRRSIVNEIKANRDNPKLLASLQSDIQTLQEIEKGLKDRHGYFGFIQNMLSPQTRRLNDQIKKHSIIEELTNNDLFVQSISFSKE